VDYCRFEEGTRKSRRTASTILSNKADKKRRVTKALEEACIAYAGCEEDQEMTADEVCMSVALVNHLSPKSAPKSRKVKEFVRDGKVTAHTQAHALTIRAHAFSKTGGMVNSNRCQGAMCDGGICML